MGSQAWRGGQRWMGRGCQCGGGGRALQGSPVGQSGGESVGWRPLMLLHPRCCCCCCCLPQPLAVAGSPPLQLIRLLLWYSEEHRSCRRYCCCCWQCWRCGWRCWERRRYHAGGAAESTFGHVYGSVAPCGWVKETVPVTTDGHTSGDPVKIARAPPAYPMER